MWLGDLYNVDRISVVRVQGLGSRNDALRFFGSTPMGLRVEKLLLDRSHRIPLNVSRLRVQGLGFRLASMVSSSRASLSKFWFGVWGFRFQVSGFGFKV